MTSEGKEEFDLLFNAAYRELHRLAKWHKSRDGCLTLGPTALLNEAYIRLANSSTVNLQSPLHLRAIVSRAMRRILVDAARKRKSQKGGRDQRPVSLSDRDLQVDEQIDLTGDEVLEIERIVEYFRNENPSRAELIILRYFGGFTAEEASKIIGWSVAETDAQWRYIRSFLANQTN